MPTTEAQTETVQKPLRRSTKKAASNGAAPKPAQDFWSTLRSLKAGEFIVYVYRCWPRTQSRAKHNYISQLSEHFDQDWLMRNFGSGEYKLQLNDADQKALKTEFVSIHNAAYPPKLDPREITSDPVNQTYWDVWAAKEPSDKKQQPEAATTHGAESSTDTARAISALEKVVDRLQTDSSAVRSSEREILTSAAKEAIQTVREQGSHGGVDVAQLLETFASLMQRFESRPSSGGGELATVLQLMQSQSDAQNKMIIELLRDRRESQPAAGGSAVSQLAALMGVMREMRAELGEGPRHEEEKPIWHSLASAVGPALQLLAANQAAAQRPAMPAGLPAGPQHAPPEAAAIPHEPTNAEPHQAAQPQEPQRQQHPAEVAQLFAAIAQPLLMHLSDEEATGEDFAAWLLNGYGAEAAHGAQQIDAVMMKQLVMASQIGPQLTSAGVSEARLELFIKQFRAFDGSDDTAPGSSA